MPRLHTQCVDLFVVLKRSALTVVFTHPRASAHTEVSTVVTSEKSAEQHTARFYVVVTHQLTVHPRPRVYYAVCVETLDTAMGVRAQRCMRLPQVYSDGPAAGAVNVPF